jgi:hypothetical protein
MEMSISFTPRPLYFRGNLHRYPLDRRLGGPQSRSGPCGEEKNLASTGNPIRTVQLYRVSYSDSHCTRNISYKIICHKISVIVLGDMIKTAYIRIPRYNKAPCNDSLLYFFFMFRFLFSVLKLAKSERMRVDYKFTDKSNKAPNEAMIINSKTLWGSRPVMVAERSEACTVLARSESGIVGSNTTQGMDVWCVCAFFCVFCLSGSVLSP